MNSKLEGQPEQSVPWEDDPQDSRSPGTGINKSIQSGISRCVLSFFLILNKTLEFKAGVGDMTRPLCPSNTLFPLKT